MEITRDLNVTIEEETLIDMHSVLNVANVILYEIMNLSTVLGDPPSLVDLYDRVVAIVSALRDRTESMRHVENIEQFVAHCEQVVTEEANRAGKSEDPRVVLSRENLRSIFDILIVRAREIVARRQNPDAWVEHDIAQLQNNFVNVLSAIELNDKGRYSIVYNLAEHEDRRYLVNFAISSWNRKSVCMPAVFQDVMRDLLANARKYTTPGGTITAGLYDGGDELRFVVTDEGVGIPDHEIEEVVLFGRRGSNVTDRVTRGGGFGLTKAYYVTRKFRGRMWIDSPVVGTTGTRVEIRIPHPTTEQ